ncbi:MAG: histidine phosphatase family protein [Polyangiales bacterium]
MGILLVRHAEAVQEQAGIDDAARWLSPHGRAQARAAAALVAQKGLTFSRFFASPRVRAVQTAELFASVLAFTEPVEVLASLSYTEPAEQAVRALSKLGGVEHVVAFGHMPTLATIAARLAATEHAGFGLAEAVWIDQGRVVWAVAPR